MKKLHLIYAATLSLIMGLGFVACGEDDPTPKPDVTPDVPTTKGWSGETKDGVAYYTLENDADLEDGEYNSYFAFTLGNSKVKAATFSVITGSNAEAQVLAKLFNNGTWISEEDDANVKAPRKVAGAINNVRKIAKKLAATRANELLPIPVSVSGKVVYVNIDKLKGLNFAEIKNLIEFWDTDSEITADKFIFGKWDEKKGKYLCEDMALIGVTYEVNVEFDSNDICKSYVTTITCPSTSWAEVMEQSLEEQIEVFEDIFGRRPVIDRSSNKVTLEAAIVSDVNKEDIVYTLQQLDWINNMPMFYQIID